MTKKEAIKERLMDKFVPIILAFLFIVIIVDGGVFGSVGLLLLVIFAGGVSTYIRLFTALSDPFHRLNKLLGDAHLFEPEAISDIHKKVASADISSSSSKNPDEPANTVIIKGYIEMSDRDPESRALSKPFVYLASTADSYYDSEDFCINDGTGRIYLKKETEIALHAPFEFSQVLKEGDSVHAMGVPVLEKNRLFLTGKKDKTRVMIEPELPHSVRLQREKDQKTLMRSGLMLIVGIIMAFVGIAMGAGTRVGSDGVDMFVNIFLMLVYFFSGSIFLWMLSLIASLTKERSKWRYAEKTMRSGWRLGILTNLFSIMINASAYYLLIGLGVAFATSFIITVIYFDFIIRVIDKPYYREANKA